MITRAKRITFLGFDVGDWLILIIGIALVSLLLCAGLSLTLAYSDGVNERIFHALPNMVRNFYTVSARPGHERNLMVPDFAADRCDRVAEGQYLFWIPCGCFGLELSRFR